MLFGTLIHMVRVLQHGTTNLLLVNLNNIVIMNQNLERVKVFIARVSERKRTIKNGLFFNTRVLY
ncbi:Uncharacterised protein [Chlamydia trachomatis]|nr:Uncharacterised protein [Chlamydia trachomatis]